MMKRRTLYIFWFLGSTLLSLWLLFPFGELERYIEGRALQAAPQLSVDLSGLGMRFPPGIGLDSVKMTPRSLPSVTVSEVKVSPLWLSLFSASPGARVSAEILGGNLLISGRAGYKAPLFRKGDMEVRGIDLKLLNPFLVQALPLPVTLSGTGGGELHVAEDEGLKGSGRVILKDVTLGFKGLPFALDDLLFSSVNGEIELNGRQVKLKELKAKGRELTAEFQGTITLSPRMEQSRINLTGAVIPDSDFVTKVTDTLPLAMLMDPKKLRQRRIPFRITGTIAKPRAVLQ